MPSSMRPTTASASTAGSAFARSVGVRRGGVSGDHAPTARETALTEAIGFGDLEALEALSPTDAELDGALPGDEPPLAFALLTGQVAVGEWILARRPALVDARYPPHDVTLLHLAAEQGSTAFAELALSHGVDITARDATFSATALGWAASTSDAARWPRGCATRTSLPEASGLSPRTRSRSGPARGDAIWSACGA